MIVLGDFMDNNIEDGTFDLIIADPPYYGVKGGFDGNNSGSIS
jgi:DNA modification methylase